jgi:Tfp pilus assembly protein PilN
MKAVNLIPPADRPGAGGVAGRSGGAVYIVLGGLAVLVVMVAALALTSHSIGNKKSDLARVEREATASEAKAASLKSYSDFSALRKTRAETVRSIAKSRFDWSFAMHELARTIPGNVWLTAVTGTVDPTVPMKGRTVTAQVRTARGTPALELLGCTTNQASVAKMMTALRAVDGVRRVSLQSAVKNDTASAGAPAGLASNADCRHGDTRYPQFTMVVFFDSRPAPTAPAASAATTPTPANP